MTASKKPMTDPQWRQTYLAQLESRANDGLRTFLRDPIVQATWWVRDAQEFFGQGWSNYPERFTVERNGVRFL